MSRPFRMPDFLAGTEPPAVASVLTSLLRLGADPEKIEILPVGIFRAYRGHLVDVLPPPGTAVGEDETVRLYVAERGTADRLPDRFLIPLRAELIPDALFDALPRKRIWRSGREAGGEAPDPEESYVRGLDGGRALLRVLDQALRRIRRDLLLLPNRLAAGAMDRGISRWLLGRFGLEPVPLEAPVERFLALYLPGLPAAVGAREEAEALARRLLRMPVAFSEDGPRPRLSLPEEIQAQLGRSRLGVDTCIGETMIDAQGSLVAQIGPLRTPEIEEMLSDPDALSNVRLILESLLPAWCELRIELLRPPGEEAIVLGRRSGALLGTNTRLHSDARPPRGDAPRPVRRPKPRPPERPKPVAPVETGETGEPKRRGGRRVQIIE